MAPPPAFWTALCFLLATGVLVGLCAWVVRKLDDFHL
jgi:hypothetical protein